MKSLASLSMMNKSYEDALDWFNRALDLINDLDQSKDLKEQHSLIKEIYYKLDYLHKSYPDAESLFNRASALYHHMN